MTADRARRGCSGALNPQSALAGLNSLPRDAASGVSAPVAASMAGSRAMSAREPGQVRKEAALQRSPAGGCGVARPELASRWTRPGTVLDGGCTVRFLRRRRRPGGTRLTGPVPASASLYRRHRPRTFADVVGQDHVVRTLRNAIEQDKVHHAYLFVGSRGTGKTSMAKILAASLNCVNGPDDHAVRRVRLLPRRSRPRPRST